MIMWERILLKVRYNKQPGKEKKKLVFYYHRERNDEHIKHIQEHNCILLLVQAKTQDPARPFWLAAAPNECVNGAHGPRRVAL